MLETKACSDPKFPQEAKGGNCMLLNSGSAISAGVLVSLGYNHLINTRKHIKPDYSSFYGHSPVHAGTYSNTIRKLKPIKPISIYILSYIHLIHLMIS